MKRNEGFTLIELLVTISVGTLVTIAAASLLLLGARVQYNTTQEADEQQTVRIVMSLLENMAGSGEFDRIETTYSGWQLMKDVRKTPADFTDDEVVFEYVNTEQTIYRGEQAGGEPILTGLNNAGATMEGNLMRLAFETERGAHYVTRVYCRTMENAGSVETTENAVEVQDKIDKYAVPSTDKRIQFLNTLAAEYANGQNTGKSPTTDEYYARWYIGDGWGQNGWNKDTPWCACFVSWAAVRSGMVERNSPYVFADVDNGMAAFQASEATWKTGNPDPGDYIFFDWSGDKKDPAHVGIVLDVDDTNQIVYTIEGNSSGRVAVRKYSVNAESIIGYGVLPGFLSA